MFSRQSEGVLLLSHDGIESRRIAVICPDNFYARARGLIGRARLGSGRGMLFARCSSIHCLGMLRKIDVVFASPFGYVLKCVPGLSPFGMAWCKGAGYVLELDAGEVSSLGISPGDHLALVPPDDRGVAA